MGGFNYFRYVIAVLLAIGLFIVANIEQHVPLTILNLTTYDISKDEISSQILSLGKGIQVYQLTSFISMLLFANLILKWDSKIMLAIGLGGMSVCHLIIPTILSLDNAISIIICILQGLFHGMIFTFFLTIMSFWTPKMENTILISISMIGYWLGLGLNSTIFFNLTYLAVPFYVFGALGLCWTVLWSLLVVGQALENPIITQNEMKYIRSNGNERGITTLSKNIRIRIFYTKSILSIFVVILCNNLNFAVATLTGPNRMLDNTYLYSYLVAIFVIVAVAFASDHLRQNHYITIIRKTIICTGLLFSAIMIPFIGIYYPEDLTFYSVLLGSFVVFQAIILTSYLVNLVDVMHHATGYALGVFLGLTRLITFLVALSPRDKGNVICWVVVVLNVVGCLLYAICGSAKREIWVTNQAETTTETSIALKKTSNVPVTPSNV